MTQTATVSFRDLEPLEEGGPIARGGFRFQDHIAVAKCLEMLTNAGLIEVWCEAEDDIVLVWTENGEEVFELVQVKSDNIRQAWTVAALCSQDNSSNGTGKTKCIFEKSLAHDRAKERCRFRVVTSWPPSLELEVLTFPIKAPSRVSRINEVHKIANKINIKIGTKLSPNNHGADFWALNTLWEHHASTEDIERANLLTLEQFLEANEIVLLSDRRRSLYERLLTRVQNASVARAIHGLHLKRFGRTEFLPWLLDSARSLLRPVDPGTSTTLTRKLQEAGVDETSIESAREQRRRYLRNRRESKYFDTEREEDFEFEVVGLLHALKVRLDANQITDDGLAFHARCIEALQMLRDKPLFNQAATDTYIFGLMYEIMNRCMHRLVRTSP